MYAEAKRLVLFDGVCNFCNSTVLFVVDHDPDERFVFAALQSDVGIKALEDHGLAGTSLDSVVLIEGDRAYTCSTAALRLAKGLRFPWPVLYYLFVWVPRPVRDAAYSYFARHRYQWFGKSDQCRIPTPELRRRILV
jgi:predicted DCC family thiol-disulfide oxidoreductase YuxK